MPSHRLNTGQRIVILIGLGVALSFFGDWATTRGQTASGWVAYAPLSRTVNPGDLAGSGLHPWVQLVIWLALTLIWILVALFLLRTAPTVGSRTNGSQD
ncbi:MAG: hypothetical protein ABSF33_05760 [Acidimicrobiales bacterium]